MSDIINRKPKIYIKMETETNTRSFGAGSSSELGERLLKEKVATILLMTLVTFLGGVLPFKFLSRLQQNSSSRSRRRWKIVINLCSCFSGGVFIAACFLDLIPETEELFTEVSKAPSKMIVFNCPF